jgi:hypothetical protein
VVGVDAEMLQPGLALLHSSKTCVHVVATSNASAPAKKWAAAIQKAIKESKLQLFD